MKKYMIEQKGRSMIEMLGVLAIVGVLSVAGIAGYSKAMSKYKINKVMDEVSTIAANTKTMFASSGLYNELTDATVAYSLGILPEEMTKSCTPNATTGLISSGDCIVNGLGGSVTLVGNQTDGTDFTLKMSGLTSEACVALMTSDWGGASGFKSVTPYANTTAGTANGPTTSASAAFDNAAAGCMVDTVTGSNYAVEWVFY